MTSLRKHIAYVLLAIYSIVFAHNVIPHHHHSDLLDNVVSVFSADECHHHHHHEGHAHSHHTHSHADDEKVQHNHDHEHHEACHFEVQPLNSKIQVLVAVLVLSDDAFRLREPLKELPKKEIDHYPQRLLEGYNYAVPLRAPPVFA